MLSPHRAMSWGQILFLVFLIYNEKHFFCIHGESSKNEESSSLCRGGSISLLYHRHWAINFSYNKNQVWCPSRNYRWEGQFFGNPTSQHLTAELQVKVSSSPLINPSQGLLAATQSMPHGTMHILHSHGISPFRVLPIL